MFHLGPSRPYHVTQVPRKRRSPPSVGPVGAAEWSYENMYNGNRCRSDCAYYVVSGWTTNISPSRLDLNVSGLCLANTHAHRRCPHHLRLLLLHDDLRLDYGLQRPLLTLRLRVLTPSAILVV